jgi:hypothetical protein
MNLQCGSLRKKEKEKKKSIQNSHRIIMAISKAVLPENASVSSSLYYAEYNRKHVCHTLVLVNLFINYHFS